MIPSAAVAGLLLRAHSAHAHVGYVIDTVDLARNGGTDWPFLLSALRDPVNVALMIGTGIAAVGLWYAARRSGLARRMHDRIQGRAASYPALFGWMLRLSLGIALIGAGSAGTLVSPALPAPAWAATLEILLGFLLLVGIAIGPVSLLAAALYLLGLAHHPALVGNLEFLAVALAIPLTAEPRPGLDDLLQFPLPPPGKRYAHRVPALLAMGTGGAMAFLAVTEKFLAPHASALVVEQYGLDAAIPVSPAMWVLSAGIIELLVGLALVLRWKPRLVSGIAFLVLSVTFFVFHEDVYAHITLFGSLSVVFAAGDGGDAASRKKAAKRAA